MILLDIHNENNILELREKLLEVRGKLFINFEEYKTPSGLTDDEHYEAMAALNMEAARLGLTFSPDSFKLLDSYVLDGVAFKLVYEDVYNALVNYIGKNRNHQPLFSEFPVKNIEDNVKKDLANESAQVKIIFLDPDRYKLNKNLRPIQLLDQKGLEDEVMSLIESTQPLSVAEMDLLECLMSKMNLSTFVENDLLSKCKMKDIQLTILSYWFKKHKNSTLKRGDLQKLYSSCIANTVDVLRLAVTLGQHTSSSLYDLTLTEENLKSLKNFKLRSIPRWLRRQMMATINADLGIEDNFGKFRYSLIRLGEVLHPGEKEFNKYPKAQEMFSAIRNNEKIITFNSTTEALFANKDGVTISCALENCVLHLSNRPTIFIRSLSRLIKEFSKHSLDVAPINDALMALHTQDIPFRNLVKCYTNLSYLAQCEELGIRITQGHLTVQNKDNCVKYFEKIGCKTRNQDKLNKVDLSAFVNTDEAGDTGYSARFVENCEKVSKTLKSIIHGYVRTLSQTENLNLFKDETTSVKIDEALKSVPVPTSSREMAISTHSFPKYSKINIPEDVKCIRLFCWWTNTKTERVDIDLRAVVISGEGEQLGVCDYTGFRGLSWAEYSGDITNGGPENGDGVSEYLDIHFDKLDMKEDENRYILFNVNSYCSIPYNQMKNCDFGWIMNPEKGVKYDFKNMVSKTKITSNAEDTCLGLLDVRNRCVYILEDDIRHASFSTSFSKMLEVYMLSTTEIWNKEIIRLIEHGSSAYSLYDFIKSSCDALSIPVVDEVEDENTMVFDSSVSSVYEVVQAIKSI